MTLIKFPSALFASCGLFLANAVWAEPNFDRELLAKDAYWLKLGHYLPTLSQGYKSTVDSDKFFFAEQGKTSPQAELNATIAALYNQDESVALISRCQYPARYTWLEQQLGNEAVLDCDELNTWREVLNPRGMTLVFPTAYMNNPSSMFGHTLLRIDAKDQTRHKELVAFAINFAAEPETQDNAALYALKGLAGSYPGRFTVMPYYRKVREYNDIESRDIWEYQLKFSEAEVNRVLLHLWEMQRAEFDYYFLDENCSYQLLALLELAREDLQLVKHFPLHAIPSDTVEVLNQNELLEKPNYRESFGTRLMHQANEIDPALFDAAKAAKNGDFPSSNDYDPQQRAAILEFAYEWLNFELYDQGLERDKTAKLLTQLLHQRSQIKSASPFSPVTKPDISPEKGHASARFGLGYQYSENQDRENLSSDNHSNRVTLDWRVAYHDLLDSQQGYIPGAQISFLDTQLSVDQNSNVRLERFYLIDAMALAPSNTLFDNTAWNIRTGFDRKPLEHKTAGRWFGQGGYGKAWGDADDLHLYTLLSAEISGGELTHYDAVIGSGVEAGLMYQASSHHRLGLQGQYLALFSGPAEQNSQMTASWHWGISRNVALRSQVRYQKWQAEDISANLTAFIYY